MRGKVERDEDRMDKLRERRCRERRKRGTRGRGKVVLGSRDVGRTSTTNFCML